MARGSRGRKPPSLGYFARRSLSLPRQPSEISRLLRRGGAGGESLRRWDISHDGLFRFRANRAKSPGSSGFHPRLPLVVNTDGLRGGRPMPIETALAASEGRMPRASCHGASGRQDAGSERPARWHGPRPEPVRARPPERPRDGMGPAPSLRAAQGSARKSGPTSTVKPGSSGDDATSPIPYSPATA